MSDLKVKEIMDSLSEADKQMFFNKLQEWKKVYLIENDVIVVLEKIKERQARELKN